MRKIILVCMVIILAGCMVLPVSKLKSGLTTQELRMLIHNPKTTKTFKSIFGYEMTVLEYARLCENTSEVSCHPYFFLFYDDKMLNYNIGDARNAELFLFEIDLNYLIKEKKITQL